MDLGYIAGGIFRGGDSVGDAGAGGIGAVGRLVRVRALVGICFDGESCARGTLAVSIGMGGFSRPRWEPGAMETCGAGCGSCSAVLCAVEHTKLFCVSSFHSLAVELADRKSTR